MNYNVQTIGKLLPLFQFNTPSRVDDRQFKNI
jgi:hypothetical protein